MQETGRRSEGGEATSARRLRRLQQATAALSRTADVLEIASELGRGIVSVLDASGAFVVQPDLESRTMRILYQASGGVEREARDIPLLEGAVTSVARTGEPWVMDDPETLAAIADDGIIPMPRPAALLVVPVVHGRRLLAVAGAHSGVPNVFDGTAVDALRTLTAQAAMALSNAQLFAESERERRQSEALADAARAAGESLRTGEVLRLISRHAISLLRADGACVALREGNYLHVVAAAGTAELLAGVHMPLRSGFPGRAVRDATAVISNAVATEPDAPRAPWFSGIERAVVVPLLTPRGVLGALMVFNRRDDFGVEDARVLQRLADQVSVAIVNARLFEEITEASRIWSSTFDAIGIGLLVVDDGFRIVRYNSRAQELVTGTVPRELAGLPFHETVLGVPRLPDADPLGQAMSEGTRVRATVRAADGRWIALTAAPHLDSGVIVTFDLATDPTPQTDLPTSDTSNSLEGG